VLQGQIDIKNNFKKPVVLGKNQEVGTIKISKTEEQVLNEQSKTTEDFYKFKKEKKVTDGFNNI
jgi:hypothetical protein